MRLSLRFLLHLFAMCVVTIALFLAMFYSYLPWITHHEDIITVPDARGLSIDEVPDFFLSKGLNVKILSDSGFTLQQPAYTVLKQVPLPTYKVKRGRKILITLNAKIPPKVLMPNLVDGSVKRAQILLTSLGLQLGKITYLPDLAQNAVLKQLYRGASIEKNTPIAQGATIDLVVGSGAGEASLTTPNLIGLRARDAEILIINTGLRLHKTHYDPSLTLKVFRTLEDHTLLSKRKLRPGYVFSQFPKVGTRARIGDNIEIWIAGAPPAAKTK